MQKIGHVTFKHEMYCIQSKILRPVKFAVAIWMTMMTAESGSQESISNHFGSFWGPIFESKKNKIKKKKN